MLVEIASALTEATTVVMSAAGTGDAAAQPEVAAAYERLCSNWHRELATLSEALRASGRATDAAADAYEAVDSDVMPGPRL